MENQEWLNSELSAELPRLRAKGEGQSIEFKSQFPKNLNNLAREIAAFATSNDGKILIGVNDSGEILGLGKAAETQRGRDEMVSRLSGLCKNIVKPVISLDVHFAVEGEAIVLVIAIPKGEAPVYYCNNKPYLRHLSASRPAEPEEVYQRIEAHLSSFSGQGTNTKEISDADLFNRELASELVDILIIADEASDRMVNPWLDIWRSHLGNSSSSLRDLASWNLATSEGLVSVLRNLANLTDDVATVRLSMGSDPKLSEKFESISAIATDLMQTRFHGEVYAQEFVEEASEFIMKTSRKLDDLISRADSYLRKGRVQEFQGLVSEIGQGILQLLHFDTSKIPSNLVSELFNSARMLHLVETRRLYADGGASVKAIKEVVRKCSNDINRVANAFGSGI